MEKRGPALVLIGPMGCGKSTIGELLAKELGWPFYDADDFHPKKNVEKMRAGIALNNEERKPWLKRLHDKIQSLIMHKKNAILACSALKQTYRDALGINQKTVKTVYLKGSYELLRKRVEQRQHPYMDKNLLKSQLKTLEEPKNGLRVDISSAPEIIVSTIIRSLSLSRISA